MAAGLMKIVGTTDGTPMIMKEYDAGGTGTKGDLVNVESGVLVVASAGDAIVGVAMEDFTDASTSVTVNITPNLIILMDNDNTGTTFAATHVGGRFDIAGTTGAQIVDTSTIDDTAAGRAGQLACIGYNPKGYDYDADTSVGLFVIAERQIA
jgi:hypothetical protein